jgi:thiol-disulfide isomerase/thioredoxin
MVEFNSVNVIYLEDTDFKNGDLYSEYQNHNGKGIFDDNVIVMVQGNYCHYCSDLKPIYQEIANNNTSSSVLFCTICIDSKQPSERAFADSKFLKKIIKKDLQGVPLLIKFKNGRATQEFTGRRDRATIEKWVYSN